MKFLLGLMMSFACFSVSQAGEVRCASLIQRTSTHQKDLLVRALANRGMSAYSIGLFNLSFGPEIQEPHKTYPNIWNQFADSLDFVPLFAEHENPQELKLNLLKRILVNLEKLPTHQHPLMALLQSLDDLNL